MWRIPLALGVFGNLFLLWAGPYSRINAACIGFLFGVWMVLELNCLTGN
jgi:hypothetical protein